MGELRFRESKNRFVSIVSFGLNAKYPLTHIINRQIVNSVLTENGLIAGDFKIETFHNESQIIYGNATKLRKERLFEWSNESGFSLVELAVSAAILTVIGAIATTSYVSAGNNIINQVNQVKSEQAANPNTQYLVTFN